MKKTSLKELRSFSKAELIRYVQYVEGEPLRAHHTAARTYIYEALAKYLTKEPRELGKPEVGARNWAASLGLKKPKVESEIVKDNLTVAAPPGAVILSAPPPVRNEFGEFVMLKYYLPIRKKEEKKGTRPPRRRKRK